MSRLTSPERESAKPIVLTWEFEDYISPADLDFLTAFKAELASEGLDSDQLVFSGFDGSDIRAGQPPARYNHIFAMNEAGWRQALNHSELNPAQYALDYDTPCIGVYDSSQLAEAFHYSATTVSENPDGTLNDRVEIVDAVQGQQLRDWPREKPFGEALVHVNYPDNSPTDALRGLVFLRRA